LLLIPSRHYRLIDQLRRAAAAVPFNIAEAYGSLEKGKKLTHLGVARGSADETRSQLRKCARDGLLTKKQTDRPSNLCRTIAKMLTGMITGME